MEVKSVKYTNLKNKIHSGKVRDIYNIDDGNWIHKGKTSKGDPLHEIWEKRQK